MPFHISNPETEALARKLSALKKTSLTKAVHIALQHELESEQAKLSLVERSRQFALEFRARGNPEKGLPADKAFIDSLYED